MDTRCPRCTTTRATWKTGIPTLCSQHMARDGSTPQLRRPSPAFCGAGSPRPCRVPASAAAPTAPRKRELQGAKDGLLCWCLVARKQKSDLAQIPLSANPRARKHFSVRRQTNRDLPFQSSGSFSPKVGFKVLKSHRHIGNPFASLKMFAEVHLVVFVPISKIGFVFVFYLLCVVFKARGWRAFGSNSNQWCHFQKRKLKPRKGKTVAAGHTAGHIGSSWDYNLTLLPFSQLKAG